MAFGPIDLIVLEFQDNNFRNEILDNLTDLVSSETIRILDLIIVRKDGKNEVNVQELQDLDPATVQAFEPLRAEISGLITVDDIRLIGKRLKENTTAAIMLFENIWAIRLKQDITFVGGRLVMHERIPNEVVAEAIKDLAEYD
jgi:hypothetical protein